MNKYILGYSFCGAQTAGAVAKAEATLSDPGGGQVADGDCRKL